MARKVNTSKESRRSKRKDRVDYTADTMAKIKALEAYYVVDNAPIAAFKSRLVSVCEKYCERLRQPAVLEAKDGE